MTEESKDLDQNRKFLPESGRLDYDGGGIPPGILSSKLLGAQCLADSEVLGAESLRRIRGR